MYFLIGFWKGVQDIQGLQSGYHEFVKTQPDFCRSSVGLGQKIWPVGSLLTGDFAHPLKFEEHFEWILSEKNHYPGSQKSN